MNADWRIEVIMYKTVQGDTWDIISKKLYGTEKFMTRLMQANPDIAEIVVFPAGVKVKAPEITVPAETLQGLPPWKTRRSDD